MAIKINPVTGKLDLVGGGGGGGGTPGGADTQIQFNDSGAFGGDSAFTFDKLTQTITLGNNTGAPVIAINKDATQDGRIIFFEGLNNRGEIQVNNAQILSVRADSELQLQVNGRVAFTSLSAGLSSANVEINGTVDSYGAGTAGEGVLRLNDVETVPVGTLTSGGLIYVSNTSLIFHDDAGDTTDLTAGGVGGANTEIQFNNAGSFDGDSRFTYNGAYLVTLGDASGSAELRIDKSAGGTSNINFYSNGVASGNIGLSSSETLNINAASTIRFQTGGNDYYTVTSSAIRSFINTGFYCKRTGSTTDPQLVPYAGDTDTGLGGSGGNSLVLTTGGTVGITLNSSQTLTLNLYSGSNKASGTATYSLATTSTGQVMKTPLAFNSGTNVFTATSKEMKFQDSDATALTTAHFGIKSYRETLTFAGEDSLTTSGGIPEGSVLLGLVVKNVSALTFGGGADAYDVYVGGGLSMPSLFVEGADGTINYADGNPVEAFNGEDPFCSGATGTTTVLANNLGNISSGTIEIVMWYKQILVS